MATEPLTCSNCGKRIAKTAAFCSRCGAPGPAATREQRDRATRPLEDASAPPQRVAQEEAQSFRSNYQPASEVQVSRAYAGFWVRLVAYVIDTVMLWVGFAVIAFAFGIILGEEVGSVLAGLAILVGPFFYFAAMESSTHQASLGKKALGLIVTDLEGFRISFGKAFGRNVGKIVSSLILGIGYLMAAWSPKKQALHDSMAGTLVLVKQR